MSSLILITFPSNNLLINGDTEVTSWSRADMDSMFSTCLHAHTVRSRQSRGENLIRHDCPCFQCLAGKWKRDREDVSTRGTRNCLSKATRARMYLRYDVFASCKLFAGNQKDRFKIRFYPVPRYIETRIQSRVERISANWIVQREPIVNLARRRTALTLAIALCECIVKVVRDLVSGF